MEHRGLYPRSRSGSSYCGGRVFSPGWQARGLKTPGPHRSEPRTAAEEHDLTCHSPVLSSSRHPRGVGGDGDPARRPGQVQRDVPLSSLPSPHRRIVRGRAAARGGARVAAGRTADAVPSSSARRAARRRSGARGREGARRRARPAPLQLHAARRASRGAGARVARARCRSTRVGTEAVAARAAFEARHDGELSYFAPVATTPGFPRALARTLNELALARVGPEALRAAAARRRRPRGAARAVRRTVRRRVSHRSRDAVRGRRAKRAATFRGQPLLLLDVPLESVVEFVFARRLIETADPALVLVPFGDLATLDHLKTLGVEPEVLEPTASSDLTALRRNLFARRQPPDGSRPATCASSRRRARAASASRSRAASCRKRATACASTRSRSSLRAPPTTSACSSTRSIAPAFPAGSIAARAGRIRPAARSSRSSAARSNSCRRAGSPNTCRSARCRRRARAARSA